MNQNMEALMVGARVSLDNAFIDPEIAKRLTSVGLTQEKVSDGMILLNNAQELYYRQIDEYGDKEAATEDIQLLKAKANGKYMRHIKLARVVLKQSSNWSKLQLEGRRFQSVSKWIDQVRAFYKGALDNPDIRLKLTEVGINKKDLEEGLSYADQMYDLLAKREKELGEAKISTLRRDQAFEKFEEWYNDYQALVRIGLEDVPEYLEILGLEQPAY